MRNEDEFGPKGMKGCAVLINYRAQDVSVANCRLDRMSDSRLFNTVRSSIFGSGCEVGGLLAAETGVFQVLWSLCRWSL